MSKIFAFLGLLLVLCGVLSQLHQQPFHLVHAKEQQATVGSIKITTTTTAIESGSSLSGTITVYDSAGKVSTVSGKVSLGLLNTGATYVGSNSLSIVNGVATFSVLLSTPITSDVVLAAGLTYDGSPYIDTKVVRVNNNAGGNKDYTDYWVGQWNVQSGCDVSTCCCLDGQVIVTREGLNLVKIQSNMKGACQTSFVTLYIGGINSDTSLSAIIGTSYTIKRIGNTIQVNNVLYNRCSGSAVCTTACPRSNASSLKVSVLGFIVMLMSFLLFIL
ncbi:hypothetical protein C9374_001520 [Naegleria lovaniensis]|uniref:Big-1 domain-containing protein n=1 Tax=Naegleria lovaniensis TaxID=51637 RepID=A0AA88KM19_NAELO|nr:uncharacterized protein C9374_001520 [Naegleria lovaniensis]KAG2387188.1 hypothetical protein C9374_001520 [Naegleria lovaniensis]